MSLDIKVFKFGEHQEQLTEPVTFKGGIQDSESEQVPEQSGLKTLENAITHLFLPKRTPAEEDDLENTELFLLANFSKSVQNLLESQKIIQLEAAKNLLEKWIKVQPKSEDFSCIDALQKEVASLKVGHTLPVYVRRQNATLLITQKVDAIELVTYRSSLPNKMVMSAVGSLSMQFPETREVIERKDLLSTPEFAQQLYELAVGEVSIALSKKTKGGQEYSDIRDVADPRMVMDWIVGLLVPATENFEDENIPEIPKISKKIRDQVSFSTSSSEASPFRRSGMLMSLKVALQMKITECLDNNLDTGRYVYKLLMLRILTDVAKQFLEAKVDMDMGTQIIAKLANRVKKLDQSYSDAVIPKGLIVFVLDLKNNCFNFTELIVRQINEKMQKHWTSVVNGNQDLAMEHIYNNRIAKKTNRGQFRKGKGSTAKLDPEEDLEHFIPKLDEFIELLSSSESDAKESQDLNSGDELTPLQRYTTSTAILSDWDFSAANFNTKVWLYDTENYIKFQCTTWNNTAKQIYDMIVKYTSTAMDSYKNDPLGMSQIALVTLKGFQLLDQIASARFSILRDYKLKINNEIFDRLLLPYKRDMDLLEGLLEYFSNLATNSAHPESLILGRKVCQNSFSVRFAQEDTQMIALRKRILGDAEVQVAGKLQEIERIREKCASIQRRLDGMTCECNWVVTTRGRQRGTGEWCHRCKLGAVLGREKKSVFRYERPLPQDEVQQWAIVFELLIPEAFAVWRSILGLLKYEILGGPIFDGESNKSLAQNWLEYNGVYGYKKFFSSFIPANIIFGSTSNPALRTYYGKHEKLDVLLNSDEDYIVNNGLGCNFYYHCFRASIRCLKTVCTFQLRNTFGFEPYANLQESLNSWSYSQNSIIAKQNECHETLTLREFITFGSLRAGHRIQFRNLYEAIYTGGLRLEEEPVLALILQTIWQVGPKNQGEREVYLDFKNKYFAEQFIDMLDGLVKLNSANYGSSRILLTAVLITRRIAEFNETLHEKICKTLQAWREIMNSWIAKIQNDLDRAKAGNFGVNLSSTKRNFLEVILCSLFSFSVSNSIAVPTIIKEEKDVVNWFCTIYQAHLNIDESPDELSQFYTNLLNFGKILPLRLNLQRKVVTERQELYVTSLNTFFCRQWKVGVQAKMTEVAFSKLEVDCSVVIAEYQETTVDQVQKHSLAFDFIHGAFLIDGYSESELPSKIRNHQLFKRYFKDVSNIRVRQQSASVYQTKVPFQGCHYEFRHHNNNSRPTFIQKRLCNKSPPTFIIKEIDSGYILVEPVYLSHVISNYFIDNYSHWLDPTKKQILFRPGSNNPSNKIQPEDYILENLTTADKVSVWKLYHAQTHHYFLSILSPGFEQVCAFLSRLELPKYINVTVNRVTNERIAHLRRYNLKFLVKANCIYYESVEYPGFNISCNQQPAGTLIGLKQGVLMENHGKKILLVPHSTITNSEQEPHQKVIISLSGLRKPPCFVYEYDNVLQRLKARNSKSAWLYLAALHAATSSPLPDPFTKVTGTEMAVGILQSACVWSCSPYDPESQAILEFIKSLAPSRKYYGKVPKVDEGVMEITEWPTGLSSMAAYDGYYIIAQKLLADSEKLQTVYGSGVLESPSWEQETSENSESLYMRAYMRYLSIYNHIAHVEYPEYFRPNERALIDRDHNAVHSLDIRDSPEDMDLESLLIVSTARLHKSTDPFRVSGYLEMDNLADFLITSVPLESPVPFEFCLTDPNTFTDILCMDFRYYWLNLYSMAISCDSKEKMDAFTIILCAFAYRGAAIEQVANLHCISLKACNKSLEFPVVSSLLTPDREYEPEYTNPSSNDFEEQTVTDILKKYPTPFSQMKKPVKPESEDCSVDYIFKKHEYMQKLKEYNAEEKAYFAKFNSDCVVLSKLLKQKYWPCDKILGNFEILHLLAKYNVRIMSGAIDDINLRLAEWHRNYKLKIFITKVQELLNTLIEIEDFMIENEESMIENEEPMDDDEEFRIENEESWTDAEVEIPVLCGDSTEVITETPKFQVIKLEDLIDKSLLEFQDEAKSLFSAGEIIGWREHKFEDPFGYQKILYLKLGQIQNDLYGMMMGSSWGKIMNQTTIAPRLEPKTLLKYLLEASIENDMKLSEIIKNYTGAFGVLCSNIKQIQRYLQATSGSDKEREKCNPGHEQWSPAEYPDWLLLELDLDIMIRSVQVQVAHQMISMPGETRNGVTQLNMGEGKTSVIVPMLCTALARKDKQLCRVTVLSSMYNMNLSSLTFAIGGLLNRRVYSVPCKRDMEFTEHCLEKVEEAYRTCLELQGVVLTLPEYRLSFRLLAYDKVLKKECDLGLKILGIENWLRQYCRDVLDESDELFNVKYQLVYTIGEHLPIDGEELRWTTCQRLLEIVNKLRGELMENYGKSNWELEYDAGKPYEFPTIRLLSKNSFLDQVVDEILQDFMLPEKDVGAVKRFLLSPETSEEDHVRVMECVFNEDPLAYIKILIYSGYLKRGVLELALMKRWRVEYGVDCKKGFRKMAVPFRAKDVAAEKTEFGHPDLAIILTHLSYYYSGLSDKQLQETFDVLKKKQIPEAIYSTWITIIPEIPECLQKYSSLNLKDVGQKYDVFNLLRKHKLVIDFWLSNCVLPRESKQFPGKLVMTAWDLAYERQLRPLTGFSGTNDSHVLLPLMITQQDLPSLQKTNENMEKTLLGPENKNHRGLAMGVSCREILEFMKADHLNVLIDAGAIMLELSNEQVANLWLEINPGIQAAVYFDKNNRLLVKSREDQGSGIPLDLSPYQGQLGSCGVFLDDQHTRGTDLKFPDSSKACVTVGTRMKRDKLIQACMRMRKLGQGHAVTFYLSHEAHGKVGSGEEITTKGVLDWVCENTREFNKDGLLYWALAARNYAQRLAAEDNFHYPYHKNPITCDTDELVDEIEILAMQCVDDEVIKLKEMYGQYTKLEKLVELIPKWFAHAEQKLIEKNDGEEIPEEIMERFDEICEQVKNRCFLHAPDKEHMSAGMMEEEQEKELELEKEIEVEEERQVERPKKVKEATPTLHPYVKQVVLSGGPVNAENDGVVRLCDVFKDTSFWNLVQPDCWKDGVYATKDFASVIQGMVAGYACTDDHLRPIQYMVTTDRVDSEVGTVCTEILVLSPHEVNELINYFRTGEAKSSLHMFSLRRTEKQDLLFGNSRLQLPASDKEGVVLEEYNRTAASLLLASGTLYLAGEEEQMAYLQFLELALQPWSAAERVANRRGMIAKTGFIRPKGRQYSELGFQSDPTELIKKILACRHTVISEHTHIMKMLDKKRRIEF